MDSLRRDDIDRARRATPEEKARQSLDAADFGFVLKRAGLRLQHPRESGEQIEERFRRWLARDE